MKKTGFSILCCMALETALTIMPCCAPAAPNPTNDSFNKAKKMLEREVYFDHRVTVYCDAGFDERKNIDLPVGFATPTHFKRAARMEWEHAVPVENFGRTFPEWREVSPECADNRSNPPQRAQMNQECLTLPPSRYQG